MINVQANVKCMKNKTSDDYFTRVYQRFVGCLEESTEYFSQYCSCKNWYSNKGPP